MIGHYRVLARIGGGGMGEVWLAEDSGLQRQVALKLLPPQFTANEDRVRRFKQEARAASALNHPNIITIYEIGESGEVHFIATEFIEGLTLRQRLTAGKLALSETVEIALQSAHALDTAHRAGIVHRDIKPENIMVRPDGLVKVLDFGLARIAESQQFVQKQAPSLQFSTEVGMVMGTPRYMSPEQARGLKVDARTDIFSLGVVLYEMLTGQPPFAGASTAETFVALLEKPPQPLTEYLPRVPEQLEIIVRKSLEKDRAQRYQTAKELLADLEQLKQQLHPHADFTDTRLLTTPTLTLSARPRDSRPTEVTTAPQHQISTKLLALRQRPAVRWGIAAMLLLGLGIGAYKLIGNTGWRRRLAGPVTIVPFATYPGVKDFASFSPDGNQIAFAWDGGQGGPRDIYLKLIGEDTPFRLTNTPEDESRLDWSPDGKYIAAVRGNGMAVMMPALPGGAERKLGKIGAGLSWTADSKLLAVPAPRTIDGGSGAIVLLAVATGEQVAQLTTPGTGDFDDQPACSPDGEYVAFLRSVGSPTNREVCVVPIKGGTVKQLTFDKRQIFGLTWTADSQEIVYASNRGNGGGMGLWRLAVDGGPPERIPTTGQNPNYPAIARNNNRLLYAERYSDTNVYLYEGAGFSAGHSAPEKLEQVKALFASSREDGSPVISPDGERIVFVSKRNGSEELWICQRDGSKPQLLSHFDSVSGTPRWSPDSRWIAFDSRIGGNVEVWVISADGGAPRNFTNAPTNEATPSWSNDGRWLYFASARGTTFGTIWRQAINDGVAEGMPLPVTRIESGEGYESPDGKLFYFSKGFNKPGLWVVPVEGGEEKLVPELSTIGDTRYWGVLKEGIYFVSRAEKPRPVIKFFSFATRQVTTLATVEKPPQTDQPGLSFALNGRWLLYTQRDHTINDIMIMDNFR